ncbi:hypothetical protein ABDJ34_08245 [Finegoldia dalianensis]|uniref:Uncharacterized protein n=1 Tax=Finegoldia dalianensis TaxID=3145239 RepID=A0ABW9KDW8_9FIRM
MKNDIQTLNQIFHQVLQDDENANGGISYIGENFGNFLLETTQLFPRNVEEYNKKLPKYNKMLIECGIKPTLIRF